MQQCLIARVLHIFALSEKLCRKITLFLIFETSDHNMKFDTKQSQKQLSLTCAFKFTTHVRIADRKSEIEYSHFNESKGALQAISITLVN